MTKQGEEFGAVPLDDGSEFGAVPIEEENFGATPVADTQPQPKFIVGPEQMQKLGAVLLGQLGGGGDPLKANAIEAVLSGNPIAKTLQEKAVGLLPSAAQDAIQAAKESGLSPQDAARWFGRSAADYVNTRLFKIPEKIIQLAGGEIADPKDSGEAIAAGFGDLGGFAGAMGTVGGFLRKFTPASGLFVPSTTVAGNVAKTVVRDAALMGLTDAAQFTGEKDVAKSALTGAAFGGMSFIPNTPLRMIMMAAAGGQPWSATARQEPLEQQIVNYGIGAFFGHKGKSLERLVNEGLEYKSKEAEYSKALDRKILDEIKYQGQGGIPKPSNTSDLIRYAVGGKTHYTPPVAESEIKNWRRSTQRFIRTAVSAIKSDPKFYFRRAANQDIAIIVDRLTGKTGSKELLKLSDAALVNLKNAIVDKRIEPAPETGFESALPEVKGKGALNWYDLFSTGVRRLPRLGLGKFEEQTLTRDIVLNKAAEASRLAARHMELTDNWKRRIGISNDAARRVFRFAEKYIDADGYEIVKDASGKITRGNSLEKPLTQAEREVSKEMREYYDILLEQINNHRVNYGDKPVAKREDYVTHLHELVLNQSLSPGARPSDAVTSMMRVIPANDKTSRFFMERNDGSRIGLKENIWDALDSYAHSVHATMLDSPLRRMDALRKYALYKTKNPGNDPLDNKVDWSGLEKHLEMVQNSYAGRKGSLAAEIDTTVEQMLSKVPTGLRATLPNAAKSLRSLIYFNTMSFRPKLVIRNMFQTALLAGNVEFKSMLKAAQNVRTPESQQAMAESKLLQTRQIGLNFGGAQAEGIQLSKPRSPLARGLGGLMDLGMQGFSWSDRGTARLAFLSGYYDVTKGKEAKKGSELYNKAVMNGDTVAAKTMIIYSAGNRSALAADLFGLSSTAGKLAGTFTTFTSGYTDWLLDTVYATGKPAFNKQVVRYLAVNALLAATLGANKVAWWKYTGIDSIPSMFKLLTGQLPVQGLTSAPTAHAGLKDILALSEDEDLSKYLWYQYEHGSDFFKDILGPLAGKAAKQVEQEMGE